ncbi:MAG: hypothetical protein JST86_19380 [Bacteroidetes bacterium]|nr:hypothetical protein [Bacteroidota bacterium]
MDFPVSGLSFSRVFIILFLAIFSYIPHQFFSAKFFLPVGNRWRSYGKNLAGIKQKFL